MSEGMKGKLRSFVQRRISVFQDEEQSEPLSSQMSQTNSTMNILEERSGGNSLLSSRASDVFPEREPMSRRNKIIIVSIVVLLATLGIVLGTTRPWENRDKKATSQIIIVPDDSPTISPVPSSYPTISSPPSVSHVPTIFTKAPTTSPRPSEMPSQQAKTGPAVMYNRVTGFISDLGVSDSSTFSRYSPDGEQGTGNVDSPQQKAINHIAQNDFIFQDWVFMNVPPPQPRLAQRYSLTVLYFALQGQNWTVGADWLDGYTHECEWYGIFCESTTVYTASELIQISRGGLTPEQKATVGRLEEMAVELRLEENGLTGSLTKEIGELQYLRTLGLFANELVGPMPVSMFTKLSKLEQLWLNNNQLTGSIPEEVGLLTDLLDLSIASNKLSGSLPTQIGRLHKLSRIQAYNNQLTGALPSELGSCTELTRLFLDQNKFEGPLPYHMGDLNKVYDLRIYQNNFSGVLPNSFSKLSNLRIFYADNNDFQGPIAQEIVAGWTSMRKLEMWNNKIEDPIPSQFGSLTNLDTLDLHNNNIKGQLPEELCNNGALRKLNLSGNDLTGTLPEMLKNCAPKLVKLHLSNNIFRGPIPSWIGDLNKVYSLHLQANELTGEVPTSIFKQKMTALEELKLEINQLSGDITDLCNAGGMTELTADCSGRFPEVECDCCTRCF